MTTRIGLYVMVFLAMLGGCEAGHISNRIDKRVDKLQSLIESTRPILKEKEGSKFYEINGQRAYIQIKGKSVDSYLLNENQLGN